MHLKDNAGKEARQIQNYDIFGKERREMMAYFAALDPMTLIRALPGNVAQGLIWGIMALGVYITFRILDFADLTVDGTLATGGAVAVMLIQGGMHPAALIFR